MACEKFPQNRDIRYLDPNFHKKVEELLFNHPEIFITETIRTQERQQCLYDVGLSQTLNSMHKKGLAVDIAFHGKELYPKDISKWDVVAKTAKTLGMEWGGSWSGFVDKPHFQCDGTVYKSEWDHLDRWQKNALNWATRNGVSNGERPLDKISRVEVMELFRKFYESMVKSK